MKAAIHLCLFLALSFISSCNKVEPMPNLEVVPEKYSGSEIIDGIYSYVFDVNKDSVIDEQNEKETYEFGIGNTVQWNSFNYATSPPEPYLLTGIWERDGDTLRIHFNNTYSHHFLGGFTYNDNSHTYLILFPYLKNSGDDGKVTGSYTSYYKATSDYWEVPFIVTTYLTINEDYTWDIKRETESPYLNGILTEEESGAWTDDDITAGKLQLIYFQNRTYLRGLIPIIYTKE